MLSYIDMHCDTLTRWMQGNVKEDVYELPETMLDVKRLKAANAMGEFFAVFFPPENRRLENPELPSDDEVFQKSYEILHKTAERYGSVFALATNYSEIIENYNQGKVSGILTIEDGRAVQAEMQKLQYFFDKGVRCLSLTWNFANCFGYPNSKEPQIMEKGLTEFGKEAVLYMQQIGMLVDVSHLSDGGFWDIVKLAKKPFVASHSNARALCGRTRNMSDEMIRALGDTGSVSGINFGPAFLVDDPRRHSSIEDLCAHILHFVQVGGEDCVGLGTDFDGVHGTFEVGEPRQMGLLFDALSKKGLSAGQIEKVAYKNVMRVIKDSVR